MYKSKILTFISFLCLTFVLFKTDVFALSESCTQAEQVKLRQQASSTQITYDFFEDEVEQTYGYTVKISGFTPDFYVYNESNGIYFEYQEGGVSQSSAFSDGTTYVLPFLATPNGPCSGYKILSKTVVLPSYNPFSKDPICVGHESYELCKKFTAIPINTYENFINRVQDYIASLENPVGEDNEDEEPITEKNMWDVIIIFFFNYYLFFLVPIIILGITGIIAIQVKKRRNIL